MSARTQKSMSLSFAKPLVVVVAAALLVVLGCLGLAKEALGDTGNNSVDQLQIPDSSFIYETPIGDLAAADSYYDKQSVQITGEVVGDIIKSEYDPLYSWIVVADSNGATLSVYMLNEACERIDTLGRYGQVGTTLQVRGVFNLACADHEGLSDVHAETVTVVKKGYLRENKVDFNTFIPGLILVFAGAALVFAYHYLSERQK